MTVSALRRLLLVGNSVSLSPLKDIAAYPDLLESRLDGKWKIVRIIRGGQTIDQFEAEILTGITEITPDAMTLQVGVNECGPRPLKRHEREWLSDLKPKWLQTLLIRAIHAWRPHIIRMRGLNQFTPLPVFADTVQRIIAKATSMHCQVLVLPITQVTSTAEIRQPCFNQEIARYNEILRSVQDNGAVYRDQRDVLGNAKPEDFSITPTSVHLNAWAHERIAECISEWLECAVHMQPVFTARGKLRRT